MALLTRPARGPRRRGPRASPGAFERSRRRLYLPFVAPALLLYLAFVVGPTVAALWISFHRWDGVSEMEWNGLGNYAALLEDPTFRTALVNTLIILVVAGVAIFVISFVLTMIVREMRWKSFVRSVLFFPHIVSAIVLSIVWGFIFQHNGTVNTILDNLFGTEPIPWLNADHLFQMILIGTVWLSTGLYVTIILAAVDRIPQHFYDDALLAGANAVQRLRFVTLPMSWDVISVAAIFWTISSLKIFEFIYAFGGTTNDLPPPAVWNSALFVYGESFGGRSPSYLFGYASASAILMLVLFTFLIVALRRLLRRDSIEF